MSNSDRDAMTNGMWDYVYNWGAGWATYAQLQLNKYSHYDFVVPLLRQNSFLNPSDLQVIDPDSEQAQKAEDLINPEDERQQMWPSLEQYIGRDIMSLMSVPVWIMEPFTVLQKMAEIMEYTHLLDSANRTSDPTLRLAYVTAFAITPYGAIERPWKPFNPILGETFQLECGNQVRFLAEQVSHHPPIGVAHAENDNFIYDIVSAPKTKFLGNSAEIYPCGRTRIQLKSTGEVFAIIPPTSKVCNLIIGHTWVDTFGQMSVVNITTGDQCDLEFVPCGWFGVGRYQFEGVLTEKRDGNQKATVSGLWNSHCDVTFTEDPSKTERLWECAEKPADDPYGRTYFCYKCSSCSEITEPLSTDSRRRPDVFALDQEESNQAASWKHRLEEMQRAEKRHRIESQDSWNPRWFDATTEDDTIEGENGLEDVPAFKWNGEFFQQKSGTVIDTPENVAGVEFAPWSYPEIHQIDQN